MLLVSLAPIVGITLPDSRPPKALSDPEPKLYVSPELLDPVPAVYVEFALEPVSIKYHHIGIVEDVTELARPSKFSVAAVPNAVNKIALLRVA